MSRASWGPRSDSTASTGDTRLPGGRPERRSASAPRVLQVALSLAPGGTERLVIEISKRTAQEFGVAVCCLDDPGSWAGELTSRGIEVIPLNRRPGFHPSLGWEIARIAHRTGASVLHCHHYSPFIYGTLAGVVSPGLKVIFTEHGRLSDAPASTKRRYVNLVLGRLPDALCSVSEDLKRHMVEEGFSANRVQVVYNGIEVGPAPTALDRETARRRLAVEADTLLLGTAARLDPVKDLETLLTATAQARQSMAGVVRLVIFGDGPERARLEAVAAALDVDSIVSFAGHRNDVRALLPALDMYVNSSTSEGVSLTILEAMAAGLPVVATRVGGNPEVVLDVETGLLVAARTPSALAAAIVALGADPARRDRLGLAGRARAERHFTMARMVESYAGLYRRLGAG